MGSDPSKLPGAVLCFDVLGPDSANGQAGTWYSIIAYDPNIKAGDTLDIIKSRYTNIEHGFPYYQRFTEPTTGDNRTNWRRSDGTRFAGVYGTKPAPGEASGPWPFASGGALAAPNLAKGVFLAYWNTDNVHMGIYTAAAVQPFDSTSTTRIMSLRRGPSSTVDLAPKGAAINKNTTPKTLYLEWYATHLLPNQLNIPAAPIK